MPKTPEAHEAVRRATLPTRQRIARQREQAQRPAMRKMLEHIHDQLTSPALNVNAIKEACDIRDNSVAIHFHAEVGAPPHAFITAARIEIARRLLTESHLPVWQISALLGYSSIQVFSRAFQRLQGQRPTHFRGYKQRRRLASPPAAATPPDRLRRILEGRASRQEAFEFIARLSALYAPSAPAASDASSVSAELA